MHAVEQPLKDWPQRRRALRELRRAATRRGNLSELVSVSSSIQPYPSPNLGAYAHSVAQAIPAALQVFVLSGRKSGQFKFMSIL